MIIKIKLKQLKICGMGDKIPLGIIYKEKRETYHEKLNFINDKPLIDKENEIEIRKIYERIHMLQRF